MAYVVHEPNQPQEDAQPVQNSSRIYRGKECCPGVTNTYHSIQLVDEIVERSSHTARSMKLNTSDDEMAVKAITQSSFDT